MAEEFGWAPPKSVNWASKKRRCEFAIPCDTRNASARQPASCAELVGGYSLRC